MQDGILIKKNYAKSSKKQHKIIKLFWNRKKDLKKKLDVKKYKINKKNKNNKIKKNHKKLIFIRFSLSSKQKYSLNFVWYF